MKALTFRAKEDISYETVDDPIIVEPTDVIVKVSLTCICGSDLHVYHEHEKGLDAGTVMGHEFVGEVVEMGKSIRTLAIGDKVMSPFTTNCGTCFYCKIGLTCRCEKGQLYGWVENGRGLHGGQAEFVRVPLADSTLEKIPEGVTLEEGMLLGDIISTGFFCADQAQIRPGEVHVVVGCGPVGLMTIAGAVEYGSERLFAIDSVDERLQMAKVFGAIPINFKKQDPEEVIKAHTEGRGADAVMEVVGNSSAGRLAYDIIRPGGIISTVGVCNDQHLAFSPVDAYNKNLTFRVGRCPAHFYMNRLTEVVRKRKYDFTSMLTHRLPLSSGRHGYDIFANKKDNCLKVVLEP